MSLQGRPEGGSAPVAHGAAVRPSGSSGAGLQLGVDGRLRHLLTLEGLPAATIRSILDAAEPFASIGEREVPSEKIGELVMRELKKLDKIGYIRFASVYRNFEDVDEFSEAIREFKKPRARSRAS